MSSHVFTIPLGVPFLDALARAVLDGDLPSPGGIAPTPLTLPDITILLPTRRAARASQDAFLSASGQDALLMPNLRPISATDEDVSLISQLSLPHARLSDDFDLPAAVEPLDRTLTLMQLVQAWSTALSRGEPHARPMTPAQTANLATELAALMDSIERENISLTALETLVPDLYAAHWEKTVGFLKIAVDAYPKILAADNLMSPAARTNALILAEATRLQTDAAATEPVIVAGVTGSIPATIELMKVVAARTNGAIVLPGLDLNLDDESWQTIVPDHPEHPQYGLKKLLDALGVARRDVTVLASASQSAALRDRAAVISEALRPSATTARWHDYTKAADPEAVTQALQGVSLIATPSALDESEVVALILREAVETPGRTAALVSPDRLLARRVAVRLQSWGITVDDSAGRPFAKTVPGTFLALIIDVMRSEFSPPALMALLKHPMCRVGLKAFDVRRFARALELMAFRAPYLGRGLIGVSAALEKYEHDRMDKAHLSRASQRLWDEDRSGAHDLVARLASAFTPLHGAFSTSNSVGLSSLASAHIAVAENLAALDEEAASELGAAHALWSGVAGETAQELFRQLLNPESPAIDIRAADYGDLYDSLVARENVRERSPVHPRVSIWGPFEARLQQPDVIVLGALNETTWPEFADPGAWLNRPMRAEIGLPQPEEDIGRAAHDFMSLLGAERVYMTRAEKIKGVPTVPSRWLMRLEALLAGMQRDTVLQADQPWLAWARARDSIIEPDRQYIKPPCPTPALHLRPRQLSVTAVEDWIRNPYSVFARHILKLDALPPLGQSPDHSLRGALVHDVLSQFSKQYPTALPDDLEQALSGIAEDVLSRYTGHPRVAAFWLPRLQRFLSWFADTEPTRRTDVRETLAEISGQLTFVTPGGPFTLTARADRLDVSDSGLVITDYKTGTLPQIEAVTSGRAPQLPLEAAIAMGDPGFPNLNGAQVRHLKFIRASGGDPAGDERDINKVDIAELAARCRSGLEALVALYDNATTPYRAVRRPKFSYDYDSYAHLARVAEWSAHVDGEDQS